MGLVMAVVMMFEGDCLLVCLIWLACGGVESVSVSFGFVYVSNFRTAL